MSGHTPGPWRVGFNDAPGRGEGREGAWIIAGEDVVVVRGGNPEGDLDYGVVSDEGEQAEKEANARLIAAAPDLLEALKGAVPILKRLDTVRHLVPGFPELEAAVAAIAKAEGK